MNTRNLFAFVLGGMLLVGSLAGCSTSASAPPDNGTPQNISYPPQTIAVVGNETGGSSATEIPGGRVDYSVYEPYGLIYDKENRYYTFNGNVVRFFNDPIAGASFTNFFSGTVDLEAEYDGNKLVGVKECSKETYDRHTQKHNRMSGLTECSTAFADGGSPSNDIPCEELFRPYAQFGLTYDSDKNELNFNGKPVRWFEDYYTIEDGAQAGNDFFNENGVVDVYAVRDLTKVVRAEDGSFDPSGKLIGVKEFSAEEFAARDIEAIKNPSPITAIAGDPPSAKETAKMAKEYEAYGVTYDARNDWWYFNGEKVRFFRDVLTSNGEGLTSGKFKGSMRVLGSADGTVDIYTVRDFDHPDASGNGTLTGIEKYSQAEFDEHTRQDTRSSSGFCTVE